MLKKTKQTSFQHILPTILVNDFPLTTTSRCTRHHSEDYKCIVKYQETIIKWWTKEGN